MYVVSPICALSFIISWVNVLVISLTTTNRFVMSCLSLHLEGNYCRQNLRPIDTVYGKTFKGENLTCLE